jgi:hypothetical protein
MLGRRNARSSGTRLDRQRRVFGMRSLSAHTVGADSGSVNKVVMLRILVWQCRELSVSSAIQRRIGRQTALCSRVLACTASWTRAAESTVPLALARRLRLVRVECVSHASPGHVKRRSLPLLRQLAALTRRRRECGGHGQEGPHLPLVGATE